MGKLIDADKLLAWLKIREGEAYTNADQVFNPSFLLGKADAFNDVVEYVKSGHSDLAPSPTIKPGDKEYVCCECKEPSSSDEWNIATLKVYGSDIYLIEDDNKAMTTFFVCPKCGSNVDFDCLEVSHD